MAYSVDSMLAVHCQSAGCCRTWKLSLTDLPPTPRNKSYRYGWAIWLKDKISDFCFHTKSDFNKCFIFILQKYFQSCFYFKRPFCELLASGYENFGLRDYRQIINRIKSQFHQKLLEITRNNFLMRKKRVELSGSAQFVLFFCGNRLSCCCR